VKREYADLLRRADAIFIEELPVAHHVRTDSLAGTPRKACATLSYRPAARSSSMKIASARRSRSAYSRFTSPRMRTPRPGPGKGCRNTNLARQAEGEAQLAHLVLEELAQRFEQLQMQRLGQPADVVVRLDGVGLLGLRTRRLDHVGIDGALCEPLHIAEFFRLGLEHLDEFPPD